MQFDLGEQPTQRQAEVKRRVTRRRKRRSRWQRMMGSLLSLNRDGSFGVGSIFILLIVVALAVAVSSYFGR